MSQSFFISQKLLEKFRKLNKDEKKEVIKVYQRSYVVYPEMVGHKIKVHKGNGFTEVDITVAMIGHHLGEFAFTRRSGQHGATGKH